MKKTITVTLLVLVLIAELAYLFVDNQHYKAILTGTKVFLPIQTHDPYDFVMGQYASVKIDNEQLELECEIPPYILKRFRGSERLFQAVLATNAYGQVVKAKVTDMPQKKGLFIPVKLYVGYEGELCYDFTLTRLYAERDVIDNISEFARAQWYSEEEHERKGPRYKVYLQSTVGKRPFFTGGFMVEDIPCQNPSWEKRDF